MIAFIIEEEGRVQRVELSSSPVHIGRGDEAEIRVESMMCSRHHARVEVADDGFVLSDLDSANGTRRNGEKIKRVALEKGDRIQVGDATITFLGGELPRAVVKPAVSVPGFSILDDLGGGVLSRVFLARQEALGRKVAVKVLRERWRSNRSVAGRFSRLARQQSRLSHPALASGIDVGQVDDVAYFIVEHLEGDTLAARLRARMSLDVAECSRILKELLGLAEAVHGQGQVLGSVHPGGILVGDAGEVWITSLGPSLGSLRSWPEEHEVELAYLPPEAVEDLEALDARGDIYQIGCVGLFMWTGRVPRPERGRDLFEALSNPLPREAFDGRRPMPPALRDLLSRWTAASPGDRPRTAEDALRQLDKALRDMNAADARMVSSAEGIAERPESQPLFKNTARFKTISFVLSIVIMVGLNVGLFLFWRSCKTTAQDEPKTEADIPSLLTETPGVKETPPTPDVAAQALEELARLETGIRAPLAEDRFDEAIDRVSTFITRWRDQAAAVEALSQATEINADLRRRRERRTHDLWAEFQARVSAKDAVSARTVFTQLESLVKATEPSRLASARQSVETLESVASSTSAPKRPEPRRPKPPVLPEGVVPREQWAELLAVALADPGASTARETLAKSRRHFAEDGEFSGSFRLLDSVDRLAGDLLKAFEPTRSKPVKLMLNDGATVEGVVENLTPSGVELSIGGTSKSFGWNNLSGDELLSRLTAPSTLDHYLGRAWIHLGAGSNEEAWFDLQGALSLSGDDAHAKKWIEETLKALVSKGPPASQRIPK